MFSRVKEPSWVGSEPLNSGLPSISLQINASMRVLEGTGKRKCRNAQSRALVNQKNAKRRAHMSCHINEPRYKLIRDEHCPSTVGSVPLKNALLLNTLRQKNTSVVDM